MSRGGRTIEQVLDANIKPFEKKIKQAEKITNSLGNKIKKITSGLVWDSSSFVAGLKMSNKEITSFADKAQAAKEEYQELVNMASKLKDSDAWGKIGEGAQQAIESAVASAEVKTKAYQRTLRGLVVGQWSKKIFGGFIKALKITGSLAGKVFGGIYKWMRRLAFAAIASGIVLMKQGMDRLAQADKRTADSINNVKNALKRLGNALASAFAPIVNFVSPILVKFINMLTRAANAVAMFFGALTGQNSIVVATGEVSDGVSGIGDAASSANDSAKELQRTLMGFDKINKLDGLNDSGGSGGGGSGGSGGGSGFETQPISSVMSDWADKLKKAWQDADFTEIGAIIGQKLKDALDAIPWETIQENARKLALSFTSFLKGFLTVDGLGESVGNTIAQALNTAIIFGKTFVDTAPWEEFGQFVADSVSAFVKNARWSDLGHTLSGAIVGVLKTFNSFVSETEWDEVGAAVVKFLKGIQWEEIFLQSQQLIGNIAKAFSKLIDGAIKEAFGEDGITLDGVVELTGKFSVKLSNLMDNSYKITKEVLIDWGAPKWVTDLLDWLYLSNPISLNINMAATLSDLFSKVYNWITGGEEGRNVLVRLGISIMSSIQNVWDWLTGKKTFKEAFLSDPSVTANVGIKQSDGWSGWGVTNWIKNKWWGDGDTTQGIGIHQSKGWKGWGVTNWMRNKWWGKASTSQGIGIQQSKGWKGWGVTNWMRKKWWGSASTSQGIGLLKGWKEKNVRTWVDDNYGGGEVTQRVKLMSNGDIHVPGGRLVKNAAGGVYKNGRWSPIQSYASGGMPNGSQLFWAREAGPELVGTLGGHTAVMNNDQIVASVSSGVAKAISSIRFKLSATPAVAPARSAQMQNAGTNNTEIIELLKTLITELQRKDFKAELDGREISKSTVGYINSETRRTGVSPILI